MSHKAIGARKSRWDEKVDRNVGNGRDNMKTEYKKPKISTQGQARDKSKKAGCSRVTLEEDQEIRNKSYIQFTKTLLYSWEDTLRRKTQD